MNNIYVFLVEDKKFKLLNLYLVTVKHFVHLQPLLSNCTSYCTESVRLQMFHDIVQLVIAQYRARAHPVTLDVFFEVNEKG